MLRFLEHHVLEEVGESGTSFDFPVGADMKLQSHRRDGIGTVFMKYDFESVVQGVHLIIDLEFSRGSCLCGTSG